MSDGGFPNWLRRQLASREWSQSDFARRLGVGTGTVSRWMKGRQPETRYCDLIADVLGVDVDFVLTLAGHRPAIEPIEADDPKTRILGLVNRIDLGKDNRVSTLEGILLMWQRTDREASRSKAD